MINQQPSFTMNMVAGIQKPHKLKGFLLKEEGEEKVEGEEEKSKRMKK